MKNLIQNVRRCKWLTVSNSIGAITRLMVIAFLAQLVIVPYTLAQQLYGGFTYSGSSQMGSLGHYDIKAGAMKIDHVFKTAFDGAYPYGEMIEVGGKLYGTTANGGQNSQGVLFEWDIATGTYSKKVEFGAIGQYHPYAGLIYMDGKVYGATSNSIFEWDIATNTVTRRVVLSHATGYYPYGTMVYSNGKFYGTTHYGGVHSRGVIFEWDPSTDVYTIKHHFDGANGGYPTATLCYYNGAFFGVTTQGGSANFGVLFKWDLATDTYSKKMDFTGPNGRSPYGGLAEVNGKLYGTTYLGGSTYSETNSGSGILYEWDPANDVFTKKYDLFVKGIYYPMAPFSKQDGKLFGTGSNSIFEYDPSTNVLINKRYTDGQNSRSQMTLVNGVDFYGVMQYGGASGRGIIYKWTPSTNVYTRLMDFSYEPNGFQPSSRLTNVREGKLHGITRQGGPTNNIPAIFEYDLVTKQFTRKREGAYPTEASSLINHRGKFYLTSYSSIYEWNELTNQLLSRVSFFGANGYGPMGNVVYHEGKFYGTTYYGGGTSDNVSDRGVIFEWDPDTNIYTKKHDFDGTNGANPSGELVLYGGKFYGTTVTGGANGFGVIFEWDPATNVYNKLIDFDAKARYCYGGLTLFADKLYGANYLGDNSLGSLFEFDPKTNLISKRFILTDYRNGAYPYSVRFTAVHGKLYGVMQGGLNGYGVVFEWDVANNVYKKTTDLTDSHSGGWIHSHLVVPGTKKRQEISFVGPPNKTYGDAPFLLEASSTSGLSVGFTSSNRNVAQISGDKVTIVGAGTAVITAYQDGNDGIYPAQAVEVTLTVAKAKLTVTADDKKREYGLANPPLTFTYSGFVNGDDETKVPKPTAYVNASQFSAVGEYTINFSYNVQPVNYTFEFVTGKMAITKAPLSARADNKTKIYGNGNPPFTITYTGFRNGENQSAVTPPSIATTATQFSNVGTYSITLSNGSARNYEFVGLEDGTLSITKAMLTVGAVNTQRKYLEENPPLALSYSGFKGTDDVGQLDEVPIAQTTATRESDAGVYDITVSGGKDNNYDFSFKKAQLTINKADQTITFEDLPEKTVLDPPFRLTASASSGLPVIFKSSDPNIVTIEGNTATIVDDGVVNITASQIGNHNYNAAVAITRSLTVTGKQEQEITFNALPTNLFVGETVSLGAVASSGLGVSYSIDDPSIAVIEGNTARLLKGGVAVITASQAGNDEFHPAEDVQQVLDVHSIEMTDLQDVYCAGSSFIISYEVAGTFDASNVFTLELSSPSGSFDNPQVLASQSGSWSGFFSGEMPADLEQSDAYRMRIRSAAPGGIVEAAQSITIDTAPIVVSFTGPVSPVALNTSVSVSLEFSDRNLSEGLIDWGDGTATAGSISGTYVTASHTYSTTGVFTVTATIRDACGKEAQASYQYIVIYDPYGGFVTGGGWFNSPAGAYAYKPEATGKANFGFVAKYQKGSSVPAGNTDFQFHAGDLRFKSTSYEWLVVAGYKAMYKGAGNLNGSSGYGFLVSAVDGEKNSSTSPDKFRIKIWDASGLVVYDNQLGAGDDAEATTAIGGGSIVIHDGGKSNGGTARMSPQEEQPMSETEESPTVAFPNPFNDFVTVEFHSEIEADVSIDLVDVTGQSFYGKMHPFSREGLYRVDLGSRAFARKIYILKVSQGRRVEFLKVVRE